MKIMLESGNVPLENGCFDWLISKALHLKQNNRCITYTIIGSWNNKNIFQIENLRVYSQKLPHPPFFSL